MKIERISDSKIKVEINGEDTRLWNVDIKKLTENAPEAQNLFRHALKQAETELNFSVDGSKLVVEAMPLGDNGFIMIISKMQYGSELVSAIAKDASIQLKLSERKRGGRKRSIPLWIYCFSSFDDLCEAVKQICSSFVGDSAVYKYKNGYYLRLKPLDATGYGAIDAKISEYCSRVKNFRLMQGYLEEHGTPMIKGDAVETIMNYFV